ncbi:MAG: hypothetical protein ACREYE_19510, partial [Gammaproteobacteria bacterium]
HHQEDRAGAGQDGADQAQIHPAPREKEGGLTVKLFKGHYTSASTLAWLAARKLSTPRASSGCVHRHCKAVIMPSRPNAVLNHGTPAYGYAPCGMLVVNIRRSAEERFNQMFS